MKGRKIVSAVKTLFIVMDSLNRHYLSAYGGSWVKTPNIDRLAARGLVFDNHYCGSLPCMPARREMMTGRLNFLEAPWGPIEPWDDCLPTLLRDAKGTYSHIITDHYHYFHSGGEAYHTLFDSWELERGQEGDRWKARLDLSSRPDRPKGKGDLVRSYWANYSSMDPEIDESYSTPRCFMRAIDFLERNHAADNWHLHLEVFDPHEPFDCPKRYLRMYDDEWAGGHFTWPEYGPVRPEVDDAQAVAHIRKCYAGSLSMADFWLGKLLDTMDRYDLWKEVDLIFTTDHGHLLGEHGYWAKNYMFDYQELVHIPMIVCPRGRSPRSVRVDSMTATIDLMPTILDLHGAAVPDAVHGRSIAPLLHSEGAGGRNLLHSALLYGYFGKDINLFDGRYTYCRQPLPGSVVHHHTAMPRGFFDFIDRTTLAGAELGRFLTDCHDVPHYRIAVPSVRHMEAPDFNPIYEVAQDPEQKRPIRDEGLESELAGKMRQLLDAVHAPQCQRVRTGLV
jgi:arylsulfatase A-like enzyme